MSAKIDFQFQPYPRASKQKYPGCSTRNFLAFLSKLVIDFSNLQGLKEVMGAYFKTLQFFHRAIWCSSSIMQESSSST